MYAIYDKVAMEYGPNFEAVNNGVASRQFVSLLNKENAVVHPDDYSLVHLGYFVRGEGTIFIQINDVPQILSTEVPYSEVDK